LHSNIAILPIDLIFEAQNASAHWSVEWAARLFPALLNHSLSVSGGEETKHIGAGDVSRPVCIFLARTTAAHDSCVLILNMDRFRASPAARGVSVLPFASANPNPPSLSATSELARHQM
jgi:hypothetical protein